MPHSAQGFYEDWSHVLCPNHVDAPSTLKPKPLFLRGEGLAFSETRAPFLLELLYALTRKCAGRDGYILSLTCSSA